jgi:hypothetical protein
MREHFLQSVAELARPIRGLRVLLYGLSGAGFPGGDGAAEAVATLPSCGIEVTYTHQLDPDLGAKLERSYDVAVITNTRVGALLEAPDRLWEAAKRNVLWFWDLRPGVVGAPLRGRVDHAFLSFRGPWTSPDGVVHAPADWAELLGCPIGYCPQASPLRAAGGEFWADAPRVLFVGDLANRTYHAGRDALCCELGARVLNARQREQRLAIEALLPTYYPSAHYCLSTSPQAPGYTSVRTYSILACGGVLLLHRFPGCDRLFAPGEHAIVFRDSDDARELLEVFDADPARRVRIAAAGRELHARKHTVTHRVLSICLQTLGHTDDFAGWLA